MAPDQIAGKAYVLFGSTGDLATRKIFPGLYALHQKNRIEGTMIVACGRRAWTSEEYRSFVKQALGGAAKGGVETFLERIHYLQGELDDAILYRSLRKLIDTQTVVYHLAIHPEWYMPIVRGLGEAGLGGRVMLEKPFGTRRDSALELETFIEKYFHPSQIFRIDHYLVKPGLEAVARYQKKSGKLVSVHCRILEELDVRGRGKFYDAVGALRDVAQNHLLLMAATSLVDSGEAEPYVQEARARVIEQLAPTGDLVRGQYIGYRDADGVAPDSESETYVRVSAESRHPSAKGVVVVLETGKALRKKETTITFSYEDGSLETFDLDASGGQAEYATLIEAAFRDDRSKFIGMGEVLASWQFIDDVREKLDSTELFIYPKGLDPKDFLGRK